MMNKTLLSFFVTATDTDAGKTFVTAALLAALRMRGLNAVALKPVQTGCTEIQGKRIAPDVAVYEKAAPGETIEPCYALRFPASPHFAAALEKRHIGIETLERYVEEYAQGREAVLVEGAGGLFVPLDEEFTLLDLLCRCRFPVILVCRNVLGAINSALLSVETLRAHSLNIAALVLNLHDESDPICCSNLDYLKAHLDFPVIALPRLAEDDFQKAAPFFQNLLDGHIREIPREESIDTTFDRAHLWHPYTSATEPLPVYGVLGAHGNRIETPQGSLIDGMSSWWCAIHGYGNQQLNRAALKQITRFSHVMFGGLTHRPAIELGKKLLNLLPQFDRVFYCDSGSVSVEVALKTALQYQQNTSRKKTKILTVLGGYHGDTFGAMSVCDPVNGMHFLFRGMLAQQIFAPRPSCRFDQPFDESSLHDLDEIFSAHSDTIAAVIIEPIVQGAGGMWFYHPRYLEHLRELCNRHGALLIFDEIATGFGRTGKLFAFQHTNVTPDIICIGKALSGGFMSFAATLCTEQVARTVSGNGNVFMHGPTFMANPLACAVSLESTEILEHSNWRENVARIEGTLRKHLEPCRSFEEVADVRVLGAIGVVEMRENVDVTVLQRFFVERGVWIRPFGKLIYLMPPFITPDTDLLRLCEAVESAIRLEKYRR